MQWDKYEDGYVISSEEGKEPIMLCKCERKCSGGTPRLRRTYYNHRKATQNQVEPGPSRRAIPTPLILPGSMRPSTRKESRPRSNSDEVAVAEKEFQPFGMDIDSPLPFSDPALSPEPLRALETLFESADESLDIDEMEQLELSDEDLNFEQLPEIESSESDSDSPPEESDNDADELDSPDNPIRSTPSPIAPVLSSLTNSALVPLLGAEAIFSPRPPWRSIPKESVKISKLKISLDFIEALESASRENS
ncbi:hypothetical protein C8F01DRAFT_636717 [Mycena amicta]|nr:hypothetical protein C8F01DRAFT_636717 [Mycena amicta]